MSKRSSNSNKPIWLIVGIIVVLIGAGLSYVLATDQGTQYTQEKDNQTQEEDLPLGQSTPLNSGNNSEGGAYHDYTAETFANTTGSRWLFFHAQWCPQCRALEKSIQEGSVPNDVTIFKVDYDTQTDLKKKYGVTLQTTVVEVDDAGALVEKFVAYDDPTVFALVNALKE